ncbi:MAG: DsbA family protein [Acidobacteria bacterium]|nr:MAG: DsbA family protein [Acidobacteriota bacterium]
MDTSKTIKRLLYVLVAINIYVASFITALGISYTLMSYNSNQSYIPEPYKAGDIEGDAVPNNGGQPNSPNNRVNAPVPTDEYFYFDNNGNKYIKNYEIIFNSARPYQFVRVEGQGKESSLNFITIFVDPFCAACHYLYGEMPAFEDKLGGDVVYMIRHFPVVSENSIYAARQIECAGKIGGAEAYYKAHLLYKDVFTSTLQIEDIGARLADRLNLDPDRLKQCAASEEIKNNVAKDMEIGYKLKFGGTPTIFLNGMLVDGALPHDALFAMFETTMNNPKPRLNVPIDELPMFSFKQ